MQKLLTAKFVESVSAPASKSRISDTKSPNLALVLYPSGKKVWVWQGRVEGKVRTITLGATAVHSLSDARDWADKLTGARDEGADIVRSQKKAESDQATADGMTIDDLFNLYMEHDAAGLRSADEKRRMYDYDIKPKIGKKLVRHVDHATLMAIIREKKRTAPVMSNRLVSLLQRLFRWATKNGRDLTHMTDNPAEGLVKLSKEEPEDRFLSDYEIGLFFRALDDLESPMGEPAYLILFTGVRRNEAYEAQWREFNLAKGEWIIDGSRTKNGKELLLPLAPHIVTLLRSRFEQTKAERSKEEREEDRMLPIHVWPSKRGDWGMTGFSKFLSALNAKMNELAKEDKETVASFSLHDVRRTLSSGMNGLRDARGRAIVSSDVVERILNHTIQGVAGVYNRWDYYGEKKDALAVWADHLMEIKKKAAPALPAPPLMLPAPG